MWNDFFGSTCGRLLTIFLLPTLSAVGLQSAALARGDSDGFASSHRLEDSDWPNWDFHTGGVFQLGGEMNSPHVGIVVGADGYRYPLPWSPTATDEKAEFEVAPYGGIELGGKSAGWVAGATALGFAVLSIAHASVH